MSNCGFWGPNWRPEWQFGGFGVRNRGFGVRNGVPNGNLGVLGAKFGVLGPKFGVLGSKFGVLGSNFGVFLGRKKARFLGVEWPEFDDFW